MKSGEIGIVPQAISVKIENNLYRNKSFSAEIVDNAKKRVLSGTPLKYANWLLFDYLAKCLKKEVPNFLTCGYDEEDLLFHIATRKFNIDKIFEK